ncbi:MAG: S41 family peptidase [Erythrobacter sp.]|uniref:S41 family peptidase n=1 Tax=Erythrobacter sp. TaxID=1042 RepID=UPI00262549ED|nr:S41 family peptidase [Erythrobacter sp.]MDJ0978932.1 S41 family peptidase [Erythrobacter sp.]
MKLFTTRRLPLAAALLCSVAAPAVAEEGFYQYPSARGDVLVFASEGDLWRTSRRGGTAIRLTNHEEEERNARVSPDGTMVAFNASYDSGDDIYVMPVAGGAPRRLTFEGGGLSTVGWSPDGQIVYSSRLTGNGQGEVLYTISPNGGEATPIPLWRANAATYSLDKSKLFFSRRGLYARARDNAVLYRGGGMAQLWNWSLGSSEEANQLLADFGAPVRMPMAHAGRIYFVSDKSGADAIWSVAEDGGDATKESDEFPFPVLQAAIDGGEIFLQNGADLHVFTIASGALETLSIDLVTDREQTRSRTLENPLRDIDAARITPSGKSLTVTARGEVALAAPLQRRRVEFMIPAGARAREAVAGPEGDNVFMILDQGEAREIVRMAADGTGEPVAITKGYDAHIWSFAVSPDAKSLLVWDKEARLQKVDVETGAVTLLSQNTTGDDNPFSTPVFSPDGEYIAYSETGSENFGNISNIYVQNLESGERVKATSGKFNDHAPVFSADGAWLYFISDRNFTPEPGSPWGDRNMGVSFPDRGELHALQLDPQAEFAFRADNELTGENDEEEDEENGEDDDSDDKTDGDEETKAAVTLAGLRDRLYKLPVKPGAARQLLASKEFLYTQIGGEWVSITIDKNDPEIETFVPEALGLSMSADRKTIAVVQQQGDALRFALVPAKDKMPKKLDGKLVRLGDWRLTIDPKEEWSQMFLDAWRMHRDFAYDPALRGVDWDAVRDQHQPLVERIGTRAELATIMGQMAAQLGILHSQVRGGDQPEDEENSQLAFLGARYTPEAGGLRIDSVYRGEADLVELQPPLRRPGVDVRAGDVITKVDGRPVASLADLRLALASKAGQQVRLDLTRSGARMSEIVTPMNARGRAMAEYYDFTEGRKEAVAALSGGEIGYLKLRAMGGGDIASFARDFFSQLDKDAMIIDVRNNSGGNIDSILIAQLLRRPWAFWGAPDGSGVEYTNMQNAYRGHIAVLIDERTYSDGETFAGGIKSLGIGPLVGKRTAGAGIWLSDRTRVIDNGGVRIAEYAQYDINGNWIVEGIGVGPDYEVENGPYATYQGDDAQLEAAVGLLQARIEEEPIPDLAPRPLSPLGTPAADVSKLD